MVVVAVGMLSIVVLVSIFIVVSSTNSICGTSYGSIVIVAVVAVVVVIERAEAICIKSVTALIAHYLYQRFAIKLLLRIVSFLRNIENMIMWKRIIIKKTSWRLLHKNCRSTDKDDKNNIGKRK